MATMEERLAKRKLDALKRGIHRVPTDPAVPFSVNIVGFGKAGADVVTEVLRKLPDDGPPLSALVIDVAGGDLGELRAVADATSPSRADVQIVSLPKTAVHELAATMADYGRFLELEYPLYHGPKDGHGWLPASFAVGQPEDATTRAYAKALYGRSYYDGVREMKAAFQRFGGRVASSDAQAVVCMVFDMGDGAGGGILVDAARHLSTVALGRAALTVGLGILPCSGDAPERRGGSLYACLNELDCFGDEANNEGVVQACGELFRNPFTAGFIVVPRQPVWEATKDLAKTHARATREVVDLLVARGGANLMEVMRLLNWVAAPSTQHSAARTPFGAKWIHMLGYADTKGALAVGASTSKRLGLRDSYHPEYIEVRVAGLDKDAEATATKLASAFSPDVPPQVVDGGERAGSVQYILPCIGKFDLDAFYSARKAYDAETPDQKVLDHSLLLEQGVILSEPSTRLVGMAGASLNGGDGWVAVPFDRLRGREGVKPSARAKLAVV